MGPSDQDVPWASTAQSKSVSIAAFWMDETEITNNEYRQFVYWVRDSLAYRLLGEQIDQYLITEDAYGEAYDPPFINWTEPINWAGEEENTILEDLFYPQHERFYRRKDIDPRKLNYEYFWIDYKQAAQKLRSTTKIVVIITIKRVNTMGKFIISKGKKYQLKTVPLSLCTIK
jgi:hypothetical protein